MESKWSHFGVEPRQGGDKKSVTVVLFSLENYGKSG